MKNPVYKIQIDDITIRCPEVSDAQAQKEAIDSSLEHLHEYMPWSYEHPQPINKLEALLKVWKEDYLNDKTYNVLVLRGKKVIASSGFHIPIDEHTLEIGYYVRADELRKNIATKVSLALTYVALNFIKVKSVEIRHNIKNIASAKIPLKLKYKRVENYFNKDDGGENGRWIMDKKLLLENKVYLRSLYETIAFYDVDGKDLA